MGNTARRDPEQMRSALGEPLSDMKSHVSNEWQYNKNGFIYVVAFFRGRARTVAFNDPTGGLIIGPVDPIGLRVGDSVDDLLRKTRAGMFDSSKGLNIGSAVMTLRRDSLLYEFQIAGGRIKAEIVTLIGTP